MENLGEGEQKNLKKELLKGKQLAEQLQVHLNVRPSPPSSSSSMDVSHDGGELLVQKILCSYEKALSLLCSNGIKRSESTSSLNGSPRSEDSDHDQRNAAPLKRNVLPTWTHKFQLSPGMALEASLDDGFSWRKYGQKGILGAKHPRGYYRCTNRHIQGCIATKRVQRSDDDPTVLEITYRGKHTCSQVSNLGAQSAGQQQNSLIIDQNLVQNQQTSPDALLNSWASLRVTTENIDTTHEPTLFPPFSYNPTPNYEAAARVESMEFSPSPSFLSPGTSGSGFSYFSASSKKSDQLSEIFSPPTSEANSRTLGLDCPFGELEMDPTFTFDNTKFFF